MQHRFSKAGQAGAPFWSYIWSVKSEVVCGVLFWCTGMAVTLRQTRSKALTIEIWYVMWPGSTLVIAVYCWSAERYLPLMVEIERKVGWYPCRSLRKSTSSFNDGDEIWWLSAVHIHPRKPFIVWIAVFWCSAWWGNGAVVLSLCSFHWFLNNTGIVIHLGTQDNHLLRKFYK